MKYQLIIRIMCFIGLCNIIFLVPITTYADMGPKPSLKIYVKNAPEDYYLDILIKQGTDDEEKVNQGREEYFDLPLYQYQEDGWAAGFVRNPRMYGGLTGEKSESTGLMVHDFGYMGLPDTFKIIVQKADGSLLISNQITPGEYNAVVLFDYNTRQVQVIQGMQSSILGSKLELLKMLVITMISTIIVESIIGKLFGVGPYSVIIVANIITQVILHTVLIGLFYLGLAQWTSMAFIMLEVLVVWLEYLFYKRYLICCSQTQPVEIIKYYVIIANITTATMGAIIQI